MNTVAERAPLALVGETAVKKPAPKKRTGEILLDNGIITASQLSLCVRAMDTLPRMGIHRKIGELILFYGFASQSDIERAIQSTGCSADGLGSFPLPMSLLKRLKAYPMSMNVDGELRMAASGSLDDRAREDIMAAARDAGMDVSSIDVVPNDRMEVLNVINAQFTPDRATIIAELADMGKRMDDSAFINQLIDHLFLDALQARASDIHLLVSSMPEYNWIGHRIDGGLKWVYLVPKESMSVIATRIKSDAGMDFSDMMHPQDGRTTVQYVGKQIDVRVSSLPIDHGESVVMRLLDSSSIPDISHLFMIHEPVARQLHNLMSENQKTGGILLVTGATGSGKSTTLNAILRGMDRATRTIHTVEDPIELRIPMVAHTQVNEAAGLTFDKALRALLRQDPDVIMVGELRDISTVEIALRGAETGHLILTTLHTGTVGESITRLLGIVEDEFRTIAKYILAAKLKGVVNQKLVKRLCTKCAKPHPIEPEVLNLLSECLGEENLPTEFYSAKGCSRCDSTGYYGRVVIPEAMFINSTHTTRAAIEEVLVHDKPFRMVYDVPGVEYYSREMAIAVVLNKGLIDAATALATLDRHVET